MTDMAKCGSADDAAGRRCPSSGYIIDVYGLLTVKNGFEASVVMALIKAIAHDCVRVSYWFGIEKSGRMFLYKEQDYICDEQLDGIITDEIMYIYDQVDWSTILMICGMAK